MTGPASSDETIAILDFGSQYAQLIARRVRENHVYSVLCPPDVTVDQLRKMNVAGLIFSGGPASVYAEGAPKCDPALLDMDLPVLGICYGMQIGCQILGGQVAPSTSREYGRTNLRMTRPERLPPNRYSLPNNERHRLVLHFSRNCVDWCFAARVADTCEYGQGRHYASMVIDGHDLHVLSRSGDHRAKSAHDGNLITFHTIPGFRRLVY